MTAMAGMYFTGDATFESFATGGIIVVAVAVVGSLTVLPAILSLLGDKVMKGRVPLIAAGASGAASAGVGGRPAAVLRHPAIAATAAAALLSSRCHPGPRDEDGKARAFNGAAPGPGVTKTLHRAQAAFRATASPRRSSSRRARRGIRRLRGAIDRLQRAALDSGRFSAPTKVEVNRAGTVAVVSLPIAVGRGTDEASNAALATLRQRLVRRPSAGSIG